MKSGKAANFILSPAAAPVPCKVLSVVVIFIHGCRLGAGHFQGASMSIGVAVCEPFQMNLLLVMSLRQWYEKNEFTYLMTCRHHLLFASGQCGILQDLAVRLL